MMAGRYKPHTGMRIRPALSQLGQPQMKTCQVWPTKAYLTKTLLCCTCLSRGYHIYEALAMFDSVHSGRLIPSTGCNLLLYKGLRYEISRGLLCQGRSGCRGETNALG